MVLSWLVGRLFGFAMARMRAVGPPWSTTVVARVHVTLSDDAGRLIYDNRGVIWGRLRWGRMERYEVFEDTVPVTAVDPWLAEHRPAFAQPVPAS